MRATKLPGRPDGGAPFPWIATLAGLRKGEILALARRHIDIDGVRVVGVRLDDLRHLAGTLTAQAGATLRETMDRLGHSSPQAAMNQRCTDRELRTRSDAR